MKENKNIKKLEKMIFYTKFERLSREIIEAW